MKQVCMSYSGSASHIANRIEEAIKKGWEVVSMVNVNNDVVVVLKMSR